MTTLGNILHPASLEIKESQSKSSSDSDAESSEDVFFDCDEYE